MLVLGIETSGQKSSVALLRDGKTVSQISLMQAGRPQTNRLIVAVQELAEQAGVLLSEIDLLGISQGPGSFTGLRVGLVFAKTFAYVHKTPLKAVGTFQATAFALPACDQVIEVVEDLRQGFVASQRFQWSGTRWTEVTELLTDEFSEWVSRPRSGTVLTGGGLERLQKQMPGKQFPADWVQLPAETRFPDASDVARLAEELYRETAGDDPFLLRPLYVRRSAAEEKLDARS